MTADVAPERPYDRLARIYDLAFKNVLHHGRLKAVKQMQLQSGRRILEVGIGTGLTLPIYPAGCRVIGLDLSVPMLARAQKRLIHMDNHPRVSLLRADAEHLPFASHSFDVVYAPYVMSAVADPVRAARELRRVCAPAGRVILLNHFRSEHPAAAWVEGLLEPITRHIGFRSDLPLPPLLEEGGLRPLSIEAVNVPPIWKLVVCAP
jgi:phosphatidylethanolamine/phosphatidyl-N-methylethanolamine N-methyltransferase